MEKLYTDKIIVVEGKYDSIKLSNIVDATIICTEGFGIFKNKEKLELLRSLAKERGLIVLTDSDSAGFMIRNYLGGSIPKELITNVYIPDLFGKERRKDKPSAEGKLGVEGVPSDVIVKALKDAGVGESSDAKASMTRQITRMDFYEDGLMGGPGSKEKRHVLLTALDLPERLSVTGLLSVINILVTYEEYQVLKNMPLYVVTALQKLRKAGFEAFVVGGCLRDSLLGISPNDWDITTSAKPEETMEVFKEFKVIPTGLKHGTVTVLIEGTEVEITTFRVDGEYADNRHPKNVSFTSNITEDLARRDFTINAMAYSPRVGFVDLYNGIENLGQGLIKCVGNPDTRFNEDALRIMRALRFASTLKFDIDEETKGSILKNAALLKNVSSERISEELLKLLMGENVTQILIDYRDVFGVIIPELIPCFDFDQKNKHHYLSVYDHIAYSVGFAPKVREVRLALLLHDIGKPNCFTVDEKGVGHFYGHGPKSREISAPILERLRLPTVFSNTVLTLIEHHDIEVWPEKKIVRRRLSKVGENTLRLLMAVRVGDALAHTQMGEDPLIEINQILSMIDEIVSEGLAYSISQLNIDGKDIINLGVVPGPKVGQIIETLLREVVDEKVPNEHESLLERVKELNGG